MGKDPNVEAETNTSEGAEEGDEEDETKLLEPRGKGR